MANPIYAKQQTQKDVVRPALVPNEITFSSSSSFLSRNMRVSLTNSLEECMEMSKGFGLFGTLAHSLYSIGSISPWRWLNYGTEILKRFSIASVQSLSIASVQSLQPVMMESPITLNQQQETADPVLSPSSVPNSDTFAPKTNLSLFATSRFKCADILPIVSYDGNNDTLTTANQFVSSTMKASLSELFAGKSKETAKLILKVTINHISKELSQFESKQQGLASFWQGNQVTDTQEPVKLTVEYALHHKKTGEEIICRQLTSTTRRHLWPTDNNKSIVMESLAEDLSRAIRREVAFTCCSRIPEWRHVSSRMLRSDYVSVVQPDELSVYMEKIQQRTQEEKEETRAVIRPSAIGTVMAWASFISYKLRVSLTNSFEECREFSNVTLLRSGLSPCKDQLLPVFCILAICVPFVEF